MGSAKPRIKIVGAGVAGLVTGLRLAVEGFRPTIFEKEREIRDSTNSGGVSFHSLYQLYLDTGFDSMPYAANNVKGIRVVYPGGGILEIRKSGYMLDRTAWLKALAEEYTRQGGDLQLYAKVSPDISGFDVLVGADGPKSMLRKRVGGKVETNTPFEHVLEARTEKMEWLYFYPDKDFSAGYVWMFPLNCRVVLGLDKGFDKLDEYRARNGIEGQVVGKTAKLETFNGTGYQSGNIALIGDAAGQANPFTRGGITPIIHASKILTGCIKEGRLDQYEARVRAHPAFSPIFSEANSIWQGLTNQDLEFIGIVSDGLQLPADFSERLKRLPRALRRPSMLRKLMTLDKAFREAYEWAL